MKNQTIDTLFHAFLNSPQTGELWDELHATSAAVDAAIEIGDADQAVALTADHELAALHAAFVAGFMAALELR